MVLKSTISELTGTEWLINAACISTLSLDSCRCFLREKWQISVLLQTQSPVVIKWDYGCYIMGVIKGDVNTHTPCRKRQMQSALLGSLYNTHTHKNPSALAPSTAFTEESAVS